MLAYTLNTNTMFLTTYVDGGGVVNLTHQSPGAFRSWFAASACKTIESPSCFGDVQLMPNEDPVTTKACSRLNSEDEIVGMIISVALYTLAVRNLRGLEWQITVYPR